MVQQTLKSDFGAAWLLTLMAAARPAASTEHRRDLRMVEPPVRKWAGRSARRFPHEWGAFSRAFIPPFNLEGGRQLSDQSPAYLLIADRNPSQLLQIVVPRPRRSGLFLHNRVVANIVPAQPGPMGSRVLPASVQGCAPWRCGCASVCCIAGRCV